MYYLFSNPSFPIICGTLNDTNSFASTSLNDSAYSISEVDFNNAKELFNYYFSKEDTKDVKI